MSVDANFGLLSSAGSQALSNFYNSSSYNSQTGKYQKNTSILGGITGGFYTTSIFSNATGIYAPQPSGVSELTGAVAGRSSSIYAGAGFGSSLIGNYYNSISSVVVGQQAPTSVFEQRLAYATGHTTTPNIDYTTGNYSNLFSTSSSSSTSSSKSSASTSSTSKSGSSYDVFSTSSNYDYSKATSATSVSGLMSSLSIMG